MESENREEAGTESLLGGSSRHVMGDYSRIVPPQHFFRTMEKTKRPLALCAEPCMGKTMFLRELADYAQSNGWNVYEISLFSLSAQEATQILTKKSTSICNGKKLKALKRLVLIDDFPPSDEYFVARQVKSIARLRMAGCLVAFSLSPEARQLIDEVPNVYVLGKNELLTFMPGIDNSEQSILNSMRLTRGIPTLVYSLPVTFCERGDVDVPITYLTSLACVASYMLRSTLGIEELRLRLGMMLLGVGSFDDLSRICGQADLEYLAKIEQDAPFFGVHVETRRFSCLHTTRFDVLNFNKQELVDLVGKHEKLALKVIALLIDREDFSKAAFVSSLIREETTWEIVLSHATEFVDAGYIELVDNALTATHSDCTLENSSKKAAKRMVDALSNTKGPMNSKDAGKTLENLTSFNGFLKQTAYITLLKLLLQKPLPALKEDLELSPLEKKIALHKRAIDLAVQGNFKYALQLLLLEQQHEKASSITSSIQTVDVELLYALLGVYQKDFDTRSSKAFSFLQEGEASALKGSVGLLKCVRYLFEKSFSVGNLYDTEQLISQAESHGNRMIQVPALLMGALLSLRSRAYPKAQLQARRAMLLSREWDSIYVTQVGKILEDVAGFFLGVIPTEKSLEAITHPSLKAACRTIYKALFKSVKGHSPVWLDEVEYGVPENAMWLMRALLSDESEFQQCLEQEMPEEWLHYLRSNEGKRDVTKWRAFRQVSGDPRTENSVIKSSRVEKKQNAHPGVYIALLGRFSLSVQGEEIAGRKIAYRSAKALLVYLALAHNHMSFRSQIAQQIWPEADQAHWQERLYQATRVIRKEVQEIKKGCEPLEASRIERTLGFNPQQVTVDIDIFTRLAKSVASSNSDEDIVHLAKQAEELYQGDLYLPEDECFRFADPIRVALRDQYIDTMVTASAAALRITHYTLAVHFAELAYLVDDMREDTLMALIQALRKCGRAQDAQQYYDLYVQKYVTKRRKMPSKQLRMIAGTEKGKESIETSGGEITKLGFYDAM
jgi:transcriptional regulator, SARP family